MLVWKYLGSTIVGVKGFDFTKDIDPPLQRGTKWPTDNSGEILIVDIVRGAKAAIYGISLGNVPSLHTWNSDGSCNNGDPKWRLLVPEEIAKKKKK